MVQSWISVVSSKAWSLNTIKVQRESETHIICRCFRLPQPTACNANLCATPPNPPWPYGYCGCAKLDQTIDLEMVAGLTNLTYYTCLENVTGDILQFRPCHTRWVWGESQGAPHPQLWNPYLASYYCIVLQVLNPIGVWLSKNLRAKPASCLIFLTKRLPGRTWPILPTQVNLTCWRCRYYSKKYGMKNAVNHLLLVYSSDGEI